MQTGPRLVERDAELATLERAVGAVAAGEGSVVVIEGRAGLGKTALAQAARALARRRGMDAPAAYCSELERDFAGGALRQLLEPLLADPLERPLDGPSAAAAQALGLRPGEPGVAASDPGFQALHGTWWLWQGLQEHRPLLLCVDDAHLCDAWSAHALNYLARRVGGLRVGLVLTMRPPPETDPPEAVEDLLHLPGTTVVQPGGLSAAGTAAVLTERLGREPGEAFAAAVQAAAAGNPFLVREVAAAWAQRDDDGPEAAARVARVVPDSVARRVERTLRTLPGPAARVAAAIAVLAPSARLAAAARVGGLTLEDAAAGVDALVGAGVIEAAEPLRFVHPLVLAAVEDRLGPGEAALLHARAAEALAESGEPDGRVAAHLLRAQPVGKPWVVDVLRSAAEQALAAGAPTQAAALIERAIAEGVPDDGELRLLLGRAAARAHRPDAVDALTAAWRSFGPEDPRYAAAARELGRALCFEGRLPEAVAVLDESVEAVSDESADVASMESELLGAMRFDATHGRGFHDLLARTAERSRRGDTAGRLLLSHHAHAAATAGRPAAEVRELALTAWGDGDFLRVRGPEAAEIWCVLYPLLWSEALDEGEEIAAVVLEEAQRQGSIMGYREVLCWRALMHTARGSVDAMETDAVVALETDETARWLDRPLTETVLIRAHLARGELEQAERVLARAEAVDEPMTAVRALLRGARGLVALERGDLDTASRIFVGGARAAAAWDNVNPNVFPWRAFAVRALVRLGDVDAAARLAREDLEVARRLGTPAATGRALHALALASPPTEARALLDAAIAELEASVDRMVLADALLRRGMLLRREQRPVDARDPLRRALDVAHACGATALEAAARDELVAAGGRPRRASMSGAGALTAAERRVAALAAEGNGNREIAQALFLTVKTVETHLTRIYRKLGVRGRDELPALVS